MIQTDYTVDSRVEHAAAMGKINEDENEHFRDFLEQNDPDMIDELVMAMNEQVSAKIDCTQCGNCCRALMVNITPPETERLAAHLNMPLETLKETYIEESMQGNMIMRSMPCPFLGGNSCTIYEHRFNECREFPHLHKPRFVHRLFGTLMHYGMCPIIFNVVEWLKIETGFKTEENVANGQLK
jgi:uncharacterized protein